MLKENAKKLEYNMNRLLFLLPVLAIGMGMAYAEPLDNVQTTVLDYSNSTATIQIDWDADDSAASYKIGCVSCFPNTQHTTSENSIIIENITPFPNGSMAMLYGIAYDIENEIVAAKQIFVNLVQ